MSKSITIPSDRGSRITVNINGVEYVYAAGATVTVPDEVAAVIENALAEKPAAGRKAYAPLDAPKRKGAATGIEVIVDDDGNLYIDAADIPTPTTVAANPTLAGTESDLTGLQIGETKYKVGGSGGGGTMIVHATYTDTTATLDKTWQELYDAAQAGVVLLFYSENDSDIVVNYPFWTSIENDFSITMYNWVTKNYDNFSASAANSYPVIIFNS